jgi:hypothetical protein
MLRHIVLAALRSFASAYHTKSSTSGIDASKPYGKGRNGRNGAYALAFVL